MTWEFLLLVVDNQFMPRTVFIPPSEEWARMPKPMERLNGLSRTTLLELHRLGHIRMSVIKRPGAQKGIRLVHMPSLLNYLEDLSKAEKM
jgi:hypothetical protein